MDYKNSDQLIFVLASPAGGGYRLGRIVCCLDDVYWYEAKVNGRYPYSVYYTEKVKGKDISAYHFDRRTELGMVPLVGERIERFWNDPNEYYDTIWPDEMKRCGADEILKSGKKLLWVLHDSFEILNRFPNARVINLIDTDIDQVIKRYLTTTALFPISIENKNVKPSEGNQHSLSIKQLKELNKDPTYRDLWAWENYSVPVYDSKYDSEYLEYVTELIRDRELKVLKENPKCLNVTWDTLDVDLIKDFIGSQSINQNYIKLINS